MDNNELLKISLTINFTLMFMVILVENNIFKMIFIFLQILNGLIFHLITKKRRKEIRKKYNEQKQEIKESIDEKIRKSILNGKTYSNFKEENYILQNLNLLSEEKKEDILEFLILIKQEFKKYDFKIDIKYIEFLDKKYVDQILKICKEIDEIKQKELIRDNLIKNEEQERIIKKLNTITEEK